MLIRLLAPSLVQRKLVGYELVHVEHKHPVGFSAVWHFHTEWRPVTLDGYGHFPGGHRAVLGSAVVSTGEVRGNEA